MVYAALLRGINVGGRAPVRMAGLKAVQTVATTRNWNTTCALHRMMEEMGRTT